MGRTCYTYKKKLNCSTTNIDINPCYKTMKSYIKKFIFQFFWSPFYICVKEKNS
jgi:hypothetical protein